MQLRLIVFCLTALLCFVFITHTVTASDFSGRQLFAAFEELARKGSFNIYADAADGKIASFTASEGEDPALTLVRLAKNQGLIALPMGSSFMVMPRERYNEQQGLQIRALDFSRLPACYASVRIRSILPQSVNSHIANEAHSVFLSGFPDDLDEAELLIDQLSSEQTQLRVYIQLSAADSATRTRLAFVCINDMPANFTFQPAARPDALLATITITLKGRDQAVLAAAFANSTDPSAKLEVNHDLDLQSETAKEFVVTVKNDIYNLSVRAEPISAEAIRVSRPLSENDDDEIIIDDDEEEATDDSEEESAAETPKVELDRPVGEVFAKIARQNGANIVCGSKVAGTLAIFRFGDRPYYEEEFNLVAQVKGLKVRRIGNTWLVGAENMRDAVESSLYSVRRFNHSSAAARIEDIREMLNRLGLSDKVRVARDTYSNTLITGGNSRVIDAIAKYVRLADEQPDMIKLHCKLNSDSLAFAEELEVPALRQIRRSFSKAETRCGIAITPGYTDKKGNISLKWLIQTAQTDNKISIGSFAMTAVAPGIALAEFDWPARTRLELAGTYSLRDRSQDDNLFSDGPEIESPHDTSEDPFFDKF
ncbi:MAG: hypothetical protein GQF41_3497 [Candidatus Rifleibacterium amylolyticum]|nr:MAG: hypothetical protein GQF41_3497 [Candidatus Rifleibacterium amylolyticum]